MGARVLFYFILYICLQTKQYFREYMEDYNTATMPHEKYIHLEKWEMAEFNRKCFAYASIPPPPSPS